MSNRTGTPQKRVPQARIGRIAMPHFLAGVGLLMTLCYVQKFTWTIKTLSGIAKFEFHDDITDLPVAC